jgi:hypothetical protein
MWPNRYTACTHNLGGVLLMFTTWGFCCDNLLLRLSSAIEGRASLKSCCSGSSVVPTQTFMNAQTTQIVPGLPTHSFSAQLHKCTPTTNSTCCMHICTSTTTMSRQCDKEE